MHARRARGRNGEDVGKGREGKVGRVTMGEGSRGEAEAEAGVRCLRFRVESL